MKLITMPDFVLEQYEQVTNNTITANEALNNCKKYALFLQTEFTLSMFLACDENGNVLDEPKGTDLNNSFYEIQVNYQQEMKYDQAKEKIMFSKLRYEQYDSQKLYFIGNTQIFNLSDGNSDLYWHHYDAESLLKEFDDTIEIINYDNNQF